jgi:hypothetical protein
MKIKLHLGAHKTATTHLQQMLKSSQEYLYQRGVALSTPTELRQKWMPSFFEYMQSGDEKFLKEIRINQSYSSWIISEENFSGVSYDLKIQSGIYPNLQKRLELFKNIFKEHEIEIFFSIRSYHEFYRSAYLEVVRNRGYLPFEEFYNEERFKDNSWVSVIEAMVELCGEESITLWRYEDFRSLMPTVLAQMTGLEDVKNIIASYQVQKTRPSLSAKSLQVLESFYSSGHPEEGKKIVEHLTKKYPIGNDYQAFMPFSHDEIQRFKNRYKQDLEYIQNRYPNINLL